MVQDFFSTLHYNGVLLIMSEIELYHKPLKKPYEPGCSDSDFSNARICNLKWQEPLIIY